MTEAHGGDTGDFLDATDEARLACALAHEARNREFIGPMTPQQREAPSQEAMAVYAHARKKADLAEALEVGTILRVDPAEIDRLATFFEEKTQQLADRAWDVAELSEVYAPGGDPVSTQAVSIFSQVAAGSGSGYLENYIKLTDLFQATAAHLRDYARQTRNDDDEAADSFHGSNFA